LGLVVATGCGFGIRSFLPANPGINEVEEKSSLAIPSLTVSLHKKRQEELQISIADKGRKLEFASDDLLELALLYIKDKQFDDAQSLFNESTLSQKGAFQESNRVGKDGLSKVWLKSMCQLGKGIVAAYKDEPKPSLEHFKEALNLPRAKLLNKDANPLNAILQKLPNWKKAVADAIERDLVNLGTDKIEPGFESLRSLFPVLPALGETLPKPKSPK
jgi:eukaryotic-like serine/threonine-protein kinase